MEQGTILRIEKISPNDGQGLRTVVFFKGCPLHCAWCSTPESQRTQPEWSYRQAKCLHCAKCIHACPHGALSISTDRTAIVRDPMQCQSCFQCAAVCPGHAIQIYGKTMTVDEVMREIRSETLFYFCSNGGVTLSGGDVLLQADFASRILRECREDCIDTCAELDLFGAYDNVAKLMPYLDRCFIDIKLMDTAAHKRWTGVDNTSILQNAVRASQDFPQVPFYIRVPLIPGVNDSAENIQHTATFCATLPNCVSLEFLPYHRLGAASYTYLGRTYPFADLPPLDRAAARAQLRPILSHDLPFTVLLSGEAF